MMRYERQQTTLTIGKLLPTLEVNPKFAIQIDGKKLALYYPHSYRGYYEDVAFCSKPSGQTARGLATLIKRSVLGKTFEGYKGGDFTMTEHTMMHHASPGDCGEPLSEVQICYKTKTINLITGEK